MKKILLAALMLPLPTLAQTYPSPTFSALTLQNPLTAANGGTGATSSTGTGSTVLSNGATLVSPALGTPSSVALTNGTGLPISTGVAGLGAGVAAGLSNAVTGSGSPVLATSPSIASPTVTGAFTATGLVTLADHATQSANTIIGNGTASTASPTALSMPSCSTTGSGLQWTSGTGFACNTSINAATLGGATFASPGAIGATTASTGAFTTLSANSAASAPLTVTGDGNVFTTNNSATPVDGPSNYFVRNATYTGGTPGNVDNTVKVIDNVSAGATTYEWALLSQINNSATGGQNVAVYGQGNADTASTGPTWGGVLQVQDESGGVSPAGRLGLEVDVDGNGADPNNVRSGVNIVAGRYLGTGTAMVVGNGVWLTASSGASYADAFSVAAPALVGFDTSQASITTAAIRIAGSQSIDFDAGDVHKLSWVSGAGLDYTVSGANAFTVSDTGAVSAASFSASGNLASGAAATTAQQVPQFQQVFAGNSATYHNVASSRAFGTTYTNSQGKPISVAVSGTSTAIAVMEGAVSGIDVAFSTAQTTAGDTIGLIFTVPAGATYSVQMTAGTGTVANWFELY